ncbi:MAG: hypothetical protein V6Z86_04175 [Hyphomicrobiales bacterium]
MKTKLLAVPAAVTFIANVVQANEISFAHGANPSNPRSIAAEK